MKLKGLINKKTWSAGGLYFALALLAGCGQAPAAEEEPGTQASNPVVEVTRIRQGEMTEYVEVKATSFYRRESALKSPIAGYVHQVKAVLGQQVRAGEPLFVLQTKESRALGHTLDSFAKSMHLSGFTTVRAAEAGYIAGVSHQQGDYITEGEPLATISDRNSLVFILNLPYELHPVMERQQTIWLTLPDSSRVAGTLAGSLARLDTVSQAERFFVQLRQPRYLPEGLIARARLVKSYRPHAQQLPRAAVLSDETETDFWVMQLMNPTMAIRVPVTTGLFTADSVEITRPLFPAGAEFLITGNYGVPDTLKVRVHRRP